MPEISSTYSTIRCRDRVSLFDVKKNDARRVVEALNHIDFVGHKLYAEIADPEKDYSRAATRRKREAASAGAGKQANGNFDKFINKKGRKGSHKK